MQGGHPSRDLAELRLVRDALVADRTATLNRGRHLRQPWRNGSTSPPNWNPSDIRLTWLKNLN